MVLAGAAAILVLAGAVPMDRIKKAAEPADAAKDLDAVKDVDAAKDAAPAKEADAKKDDHEEDYGYDGERLYADQVCALRASSCGSRAGAGRGRGG